MTSLNTVGTDTRLVTAAQRQQTQTPPRIGTKTQPTTTNALVVVVVIVVVSLAAAAPAPLAVAEIVSTTMSIAMFQAHQRHLQPQLQPQPPHNYYLMASSPSSSSSKPAGKPSLLTQVVMAGTAAVITVTFIHPIDVVKVRNAPWQLSMQLVKFPCTCHHT
jgi:hypothetical protein